MVEIFKTIAECCGWATLIAFGIFGISCCAFATIGTIKSVIDYVKEG